MGIYDFEYGTTPRKIEPKYNANKKKKSDFQKQIKINQEQRKNAIKLEKKKHNKNVALVAAVFLLLLTISYRSSLINERFNSLQKDKEKLASIEKSNGQLEVSIEGSLNLSNIEEAAKNKLGMQKIDNSQKVFVTLDKKDYVESSSDYIDENKGIQKNWLEKFIDKIFNK